VKPLNSSRYIGNNSKRVLPLFISMMVGVMLIYFLSLIVKSGYDFEEDTDFKFLRKYTMINITENGDIPENILKEIESDSNTEKIVPFLYSSGSLSLKNIMSNNSYRTLNLFQEDIQYVLDSLNLKLIEGKLPSMNKDEILLHERYAKQKKLKVGDSFGSEINPEYGLKGSYKISGLMGGPVVLAVVSDNKNNIPRELLAKKFVMFSIKDVSDRRLVNSILSHANGNLAIGELDSVKEISYKMLSINNVLFAVLTFFITFVLSISMSNLSYISFMNRESEFHLLAAIGYNRRFLLKKLGKENALVYTAGYFSGILLCILLVYLLNLSLFEPQGKLMPLLSVSGIFTALIIPVIVGIVSLFPAAAQLRKRDTVEVIGSTV
jgi:putative ABC transport system permease protein